MPARSTDYRKRNGLTQVGLNWDDATWALAHEVTGTTTKRAAVEGLLRGVIASHRIERQITPNGKDAKAEAPVWLGAPDEL